jgi:hypothetical protein
MLGLDAGVIPTAKERIFRTDGLRSHIQRSLPQGTRSPRPWWESVVIRGTWLP